LVGGGGKTGVVNGKGLEGEGKKTKDTEKKRTVSQKKRRVFQGEGRAFPLLRKHSHVGGKRRKKQTAGFRERKGKTQARAIKMGGGTTVPCVKIEKEGATEC